MPLSDLIKRDSIIFDVQVQKWEGERLSSYLRSLGTCEMSLKLPTLQGLCGLVLVYSKNWMFSSLQHCPQKDISHRCCLEFYRSSQPWWCTPIIPALEWLREETKWRPDWPVDSETPSQNKAKTKEKRIPPATLKYKEGRGGGDSGTKGLPDKHEKLSSGYP